MTLLARANPVPQRFDLWELTTLYQEVHGALLVSRPRPARHRRTPSGFCPRQNVTPRREPDSGNLVDYYLYRTAAREQRFAPEDVITSAIPIRAIPYTGGLSPLRACYEQVALTSDYAAFKKAKFENHAIPDAIIVAG